MLSLPHSFLPLPGCSADLLMAATPGRPPTAACPLLSLFLSFTCHLSLSLSTSLCPCLSLSLFVLWLQPATKASGRGGMGPDHRGGAVAAASERWHVQGASGKPLPPCTLPLFFPFSLLSIASWWQGAAPTRSNDGRGTVSDETRPVARPGSVRSEQR